MGSNAKQWVGKVVAGRYLVERPLAEGGMGAVFEATQTSLGRKIALKVIKASQQDDADAMKRFQREAEVVARLQHPNIVTVVDAGTADDGTLFLAMELVPGETVRATLRREHHLPWARALAVVEDVASALLAAHEAGVIHRDLKAENVMLVKPAGRAEHAKVLDFGVAKLTARTEAPPVTGSGFVAGTPGCIAPEQMLGKSDDPRSDLYSLGVLLFEMLVGQPPFVSTSGVELMMRHLTEPAPRVADVGRGQGIEVPGAVDELCASLLSKDPEQRPRDAARLIDVVRGLRDSGVATMPDLRTPGSGAGLAPVAMAAPPATEAATRPTPLGVASPVASRRRHWAIKAAAVVVGLGCAVGAYAFVTGKMANRLATTEEGLRAVDKAIEAIWHGDTLAAEREAERAQRVDPAATGAAIIRAYVAAAEGRPLARYDSRIAEARELAARAAKMMALASHTQEMLDNLSTYDLDTAQEKALQHADTCNDSLEALVNATRLTIYEDRPERVRALFAIAKMPQAPAVRLGLVKADLFQGSPDSLANARRTLDALEREIPPTGQMVQLRTQLELQEGNVEAARQALLAWAGQNGDDLGARRRLAALYARGSPDRADDAAAMDQLEATAQRARELARAGGERAVDELAALGNSYATLGRLKDANALWESAMTLAGADHRRRCEIAAVATLFTRLATDGPQGKRWSDAILAEAHLLDPADPTRERGELVWHATQVLRAAANPEVDVDAMRGSAAFLAKTQQDIPMLVDAALWSYSVAAARAARDPVSAEHLLAEANARLERMGPCSQPEHGARLLLLQAQQEQEPAARATKLAAAATALVAATSDQQRWRCTLGNETPSQALALGYGEALLNLAQVLIQLGDPRGPAALDRAASWWAGADADTRPALGIAALRAALSAAPAPPGP